MTLNLTFILVGRIPATHWYSVLKRALAPLGTLYIVSEGDAVTAVQQRECDVVIVDAGAVTAAASLTSRLRLHWPKAQIIVATASPTWQQAKKAFQAGAADYIRKSLDEKELYAKVSAVVDVSHCPN